MTKKILLIEDEPNLLNSLSFIMEKQGYEVLRSLTGEEGVALALEHRPDLALVDIGLPGIDGFEVAARLKATRRQYGMTIVFLTGRDEEDDIVRALEDLADDYIVKPVRPRVLMARIGALLSRRLGKDRSSEDPIVLGVLTIDPSNYEVALDGTPLALTVTEFRVLTLLARNPGKAFMRSRIIAEVHGEDCHLSEKSIDFQIHSLRRKLGSHAEMLVTVRGVGFKLRAG